MDQYTLPYVFLHHIADAPMRAGLPLQPLRIAARLPNSTLLSHARMGWA